MNSPCLAIVGKPQPTPQGAENARALADHLGRAGTDHRVGTGAGYRPCAAHAGALAGGAGTIAVVGTGLDRVYPRAPSRPWRTQIAERGLIISEFDLGTEAAGGQLPATQPQSSPA